MTGPHSLRCLATDQRASAAACADHRQHMRRAGVPATAETFTQLQPHARMTHHIADVSCFHAVLGHDPELIAGASVANRSTARLAGLPTNSFQERIPRERDTHSK